ncbi:MAG: xanthine dehydrogenase family protein molybdopterin-binding subunit [Coriobacteriales bacterium]|jgi:CO/xanthine dehydrogenase Mo-binding subunit|nr:xanthine dehydrogenase family protein molybdopterin-binding subunit [Coriobacteriales bacterium]
MRQISQSVIKKDHKEKMDGSALYVGDYPCKDTLFGVFVRSPHAHASFTEIRYPPMPPGCFAVDHRDVPGENIAHVVLDDSPVFEESEVFYRGDPVALVVGSSRDEAAGLAAATEVDYEVLPAILDIDDADTVFFDYRYGRGEVEAAFAQADRVYDETFETGYQEQGYLEPQGMTGRYADGVLTLHGSLQCPYYVHGAVAKALGLPAANVRIVQDCTGGGFGGKEAYPSILACQVAVAACKAPGKEVRVIFERREDMEFTSKRHPSRNRYRAAVKDGRITALEIDVRFNSGAFTTLSPVVLQRGVIAAPGVYDVPNLKVQGRALRTHTVPTGAYRGFGAPQTFFSIERLMDHIASDLGVEPLDFRLAHLVRQGSPTSTSGVYHYPVPLPEMVDEVLEMSGFRAKRRAYAAEQTGRHRSGIGIALWFHGAGFTGSGERDIIKGVAQIRKRADGKIDVLTSQSDIGQGIKTTLTKIVAAELGVPYDDVNHMNPDTKEVPNSGPTVASRSLMVVGELLRCAAVRLRDEWQDGVEQLVEERYVEPDFMVPFDQEKFEGDAYPTYAWGVSAVELRFDALTGVSETLGCWSSFDVGTPMDVAIVTGQMEGGVLQGLGYASMEQMETDATGRIRNNSYSDYILPTSQDVPELKTQLHVVEYPFGPYGAKGAGELPLVGVPAAFVAAAEQALGTDELRHIPLKAEEALPYLMGGERGVRR